jgi:uncharacterized short protein YbdD (DUF466 family)
MPRNAPRVAGNPGAGIGPAGSRAWLSRIARIAWRGLREWCGDSAYERYLCSQATQNSGRRTLTSSEFYVDQLNRRYSRPNRCC